MNATPAFFHGAGRTSASGQLGTPRESASVAFVFKFVCFGLKNTRFVVDFLKTNAPLGFFHSN